MTTTATATKQQQQQQQWAELSIKRLKDGQIRSIALKLTLWHIHKRVRFWFRGKNRINLLVFQKLNVVFFVLLFSTYFQYNIYPYAFATYFSFVCLNCLFFNRLWFFFFYMGLPHSFISYIVVNSNFMPSATIAKVASLLTHLLRLWSIVCMEILLTVVTDQHVVKWSTLDRCTQRMNICLTIIITACVTNKWDLKYRQRTKKQTNNDIYLGLSYTHKNHNCICIFISLSSIECDWI